MVPNKSKGNEKAKQQRVILSLNHLEVLMISQKHYLQNGLGKLDLYLSSPLAKPRNMKRKDTSKKSQTDWERLKNMADEDIDLSETPELTPEMFARSVVRRGLKPVTRKSQITLRVDGDVLEWFKEQGQGYQTLINSLLRAYMEAHK